MNEKDIEVLLDVHAMLLVLSGVAKYNKAVNMEYSDTHIEKKADELIKIVRVHLQKK